MRRWYVIKTKGRGEQTADLNLHLQGYETYLPLVYKDRRKNPYGNVVVESLFPTYFFIRMDIGKDDWRPIKHTKGVVKIVSGGENDEPLPVDDKIIEILKGRENEQGVHEITDWQYRKGDRVRVKAGPFHDVEAIIHAKKDDRIVILLDVMGKTLKLKMQQKHVEPV